MAAILQRILEFLKRHYEKIVLCLVILCLGAAGVMLPKQIEDAKAQTDQPLPAPPKDTTMPALPIGPLIASIQQVTNPPVMALSGEHNLFNPVAWKRKPNGDLLKILKTGADALEVTAISNLYERIGYDHPAVGASGVYFMFWQTNSQRAKGESAELNQMPRSGLYKIRAVKGPADNPTQLRLEIIDTGEVVWVSKEAPYQRVDGHLADLRYDPEAKPFTRKKVEDTLTLDGEPYKIVAITDDAVTVEQSTTTMRTTIRLAGNSGAGTRP